MKKVNNNKYARYLLDRYCDMPYNTLIDKGDMFRVNTGGKKAEVTLVASVYVPEQKKGTIQFPLVAKA